MIYLLNAASTSWTIIILPILMIAMMALMMIPQRKRQKKMAEMINQIGPGTHIKSIGGLIGVVTEVKSDNTLVVNIGVNEYPTYIVLDKNAIYQNLDAQPLNAPVKKNKDEVSVIEEVKKDNEKKIDE